MKDGSGGGVNLHCVHGGGSIGYRLGSERAAHLTKGRCDGAMDSQKAEASHH